MVELAGPLSVVDDHISLIPDQVRGLAGYVIEQCPGGGDEENNLGTLTAGLGGFVTSGLETVYDWMEQSSLHLRPENWYMRTLLLSRSAREICDG